MFANGWVSDSKYDIKLKIQEIAQCCDDYNVIIVDFATCIEHLFKTTTYNINTAAYAVLKVIDAVLANNVLFHDIILVGFSVGAQIAAAACKLFTSERLNGDGKLPLLVAIDPSYACKPEYVHLAQDVADKVLVIHGNNGNYGYKEAIGTVDYYPNGDIKLQPPCKSSQVCSHVFPLFLFVEAVCQPNNFLAIKCPDRNKWQKGTCAKNDVIPINLDLPDRAQGKYFSTTNAKAPYGRALEGINPPK